MCLLASSHGRTKYRDIFTAMQSIGRPSGSQHFGWKPNLVVTSGKPMPGPQGHRDCHGHRRLQRGGAVAAVRRGGAARCGAAQPKRRPPRTQLVARRLGGPSSQTAPDTCVTRQSDFVIYMTECSMYVTFAA